jgi:uncharacterized membrane protein
MTRLVITLLTALGAGLIAGVFFAFSTFVMKALARIPSAQGIAAMQSINVVVINPWFMGVFLGTAVGCVGLGIWSLMNWKEAGVGWILTGSFAYLVGTLMVTMWFNVPRNDALAKVDPTSAEGARLWASYISSWTAWNHVRTAAALIAACLMTIALWLSGGDLRQS